MAEYGAHAQGQASITSAASASATLVAAPGTNSEARFHLTRGFITVSGLEATSSIGFNVMQTTAEGTQAATLFSITTSVTGSYDFNLGDRGFACSSSAPRIAIQNTGDASVNCIFVGYHTGSGTT